MENQSSDTKQCPNCKELIHKNARVCKHCGKKFMSERRKIAYGVIIGIFVLFMVIGSGSDSSSTSPAPAPTGHSDIEVCVEAEFLLKQFLKSPSTADFPTCSSMIIERLSEEQFKVSSYVDSQNGFGAMIRSNWSVQYHYTDGGAKTQLEHVVVGGETVFGK